MARSRKPSRAPHTIINNHHQGQLRFSGLPFLVLSPSITTPSCLLQYPSNPQLPHPACCRTPATTSKFAVVPSVAVSQQQPKTRRAFRNLALELHFDRLLHWRLSVAAVAGNNSSSLEQAVKPNDVATVRMLMSTSFATLFFVVIIIIVFICCLILTHSYGGFLFIPTCFVLFASSCGDTCANA